MTKKYRLTGCSKFLVFFIIAGPLAYFGAYYINTGDPMAGLHALGIGMEGTGEQTSSIVEEQPKATVETLQLRVEELSKALEDCQNSKDSTSTEEK